MKDYKVLVGDCLDLLPTIPDGSVDLILADPPYGITSAKFDSQIPLDRLWPELWRVAKPSAAIVLTASQPFSSQLVMSQVRLFRHEWIWIKNRGSNFANTVREPMKEHEQVLVFSRGKWTYNKQMQPRTGGGLNLVGKRVGTGQKQRENLNAFGGFPTTEALPELRVPSTWQKFNTEVGLHPQQKPLALMRYLVRTYSNPGELVLDFSCGSGTTGVAAITEGRRTICIERDEVFAAKAIRRMEAA